jgi:hypothetical protein
MSRAQAARIEMHGSGAFVLGFGPPRACPHWNHADIGVMNRSGVRMNKSSSLPWWSALGFAKEAPAPDTDYADMGTAFGLDASFGRAAMPDPPAANSDRGRSPSAGAGPLKKR